MLKAQGNIATDQIDFQTAPLLADVYPPRFSQKGLRSLEMKGLVVVKKAIKAHKGRMNRFLIV